MNKTSLCDEIKTDPLIRTVVACIKQATDDDVKRYLDEFHPGTTNGLPHQIHDWINGHLRDHVTSNKVYTMEIKRASWRGRLIIDEEHKYVYSIMRIDRLKSLRKEKRNSPHYLHTIVGSLNKELEAENKQLSIEAYDYSRFSQEELESDYTRLFGNKVNPSEGYKHCLILFATRKTELYDVRLCIVDKDLDVVEDKPLIDFIKPDYAELTNVKSVDTVSDDSENEIDDNATEQGGKPLVKLKTIQEPSND